MYTNGSDGASYHISPKDIARSDIMNRKSHDGHIVGQWL